MADGRHEGSRLRIAIVASWYPTAVEPIGGIFVRDQAEILAKDHEVLVVAPRVLTWRGTLKSLRRGAFPPEDDRLPTERPWALHIRHSLRASEWLYQNAVARGIRRHSRAGRPDIIHAHVSLPAGVAAVRIGSARGIPVVLTEHAGPFGALLASAHARASVAVALRGATRVLAVGINLAREIQAFEAVRVDVVGNVVHPVFLESALMPTRPRDPFRLLAVGFAKPEKRFDLLLEAQAMAAHRGMAIETTIVAEGPELEKLKLQASRLGLADSVRFAPMVDRAGLVEWFRWTDAVASASDHESFGLTLAEALAMGRPVITTASGGPETFVGPDIGIVVRSGSASAFAEGMASLPGFVERFNPDTARRRVETAFGPDTFRTSLRRTYESVLSGLLSRRDVVD